eukprot:IDg5378t1
MADGRAGRLNEKDVHATHNEHHRETAYFVARYKVLCDYHSNEADLSIDDGLVAFYPSMSPFWLSHLSYWHSAFYSSMPPDSIGVLPPLSKPALNMLVVDQSEDATDSSPAPVADVVAVDRLSSTARVVALSSSTAVAIKE